MKMGFSPFFLVFACLFASIFSYGTASTTPAVNASTSCTPQQTPCALGCCPYAEGVCCADGFECCQHGQTCVPFIGICLGLNEENGKPSLVSSKTSPLTNMVTACPAPYTPCGPDKCCRYTQATCCEDGEHCCPHGYECDLPRKTCVKKSAGYLDYYLSGPPQASVLKMAPKSQYKSCPGSNRVCPSYTSCCVDDNGEWSCCPNPSLPQIKFGGGECCDTIFGHMCCPDSFPHCTPIGCMA